MTDDDAAVSTVEPQRIRRRSIDAVLADARSRLRRLSPSEAVTARHAGAVIVDIRPAAQREAEGGPDDVLVVERNVLEWRFDPASDARLPVAGYDLQVIVLCQEGYTSSLAAAALQDLGIWRATDVIGGWAAWRTAGDSRQAEQRVAPAPAPRAGSLIGKGDEQPEEVKDERISTRAAAVERR